jgi:hypothetical protein
MRSKRTGFALTMNRLLDFCQSMGRAGQIGERMDGQNGRPLSFEVILKWLTHLSMELWASAEAWAKHGKEGTQQTRLDFANNVGESVGKARCRARSLLVRVVANELALENGWVRRVRNCIAG